MSRPAFTLPLAACTTSGAADAVPAADVQGLYVHVPFCFHKCHYCDFYSITRQSPQRMQRFVDLLLLEADTWRRTATASRMCPRTVFFGGGTPSLLPLDQMRRLIEGLRSRLDLSQVNEWTFEANPATVTPQYCRMLRESGVDRISFGAQSFERSELATLERHHDPEDVPRSVEIARSAGFRRINLDLIYAIPGQDLPSWSRSLEAAIELGTTHLSCYGLTYEPNTPMAVKKRLGLLNAAEEELELEMFRHTRRRLTEAGLPPYEISNYAQPGEQCRHNLVYWSGGNYVGLGPSAASHLEGHRFRNRPHLGEWERAVQSGQLPVIDYEILSPARRLGELVMLMLRLSTPLRFDELSARSGLDARRLCAEPLERLGNAGLLVVDYAGFCLSERGLELADTVAGELLQACR